VKPSSYKLPEQNNKYMNRTAFSIPVVVVVSLIAIAMFSFALVVNSTLIYGQVARPNGKQAQPSHSSLPSSSSSSSSSSQKSLPRLHAVRITSPTKGQQVPIGKALVVSGITNTTLATKNSGSTTTSPSGCEVYIMINGVKPYQLATGTGPGGAADYSKWNYVLASNYSAIKPVPDNKITAKYACSGTHAAISYYSVNVTGVSMSPTRIGQVAGSQATNPNSSIKTTSPASSNSTNLIYLGTPGGVIRHPSNSRLGSTSETGISNLPGRSVVNNDATGMGNPNSWYWNDGSGGGSSRSKSGNLPDMGYSGYHDGGISSKTVANPRMAKAPQYTSPNMIGGKVDNRGGSYGGGGVGGANDETFGQSSRTNDNPNGYSSLHEKTNELKNAIIDNLKRHIGLPLPIPN
jgi:hypothetical protein